MDIVQLLFRARTSELDQAEKKLDRVGKAADKTESKATALKGAFNEFKSVGGPIGDVANRLEDLQGRANGAMRAVSGLASSGMAMASAAAVATGALVALAGAAGIIAAFRFVGILDEISKLGQEFGYSASQAALLDAKLQGRGGLAGFEKDIQRVTRALGKADEESSRANAAFETLGIRVQDNAKPVDVLNDLVEKYGKKVKENNLTTAEQQAMQLALGVTWKETIFRQEEAAAALEMYNKFAAANLGISTKGEAATAAYNDAMDGLSYVFKIVGSQLVGIVMPAFTSLVETFVESYTNGGLVAGAFKLITLATNVVMVPLRALVNLFITFDAIVQSAGKSIGAFFAAVVSGNMNPLKELKADLAALWANADKRIVPLWEGGTTDFNKPSAANTTPDKKPPPKPGKDTKTIPGASADADGPFKDYLAMLDEKAKRELQDLARYEAREAAAEAEYQSLLQRIRGYQDLVDPTQRYRDIQNQLNLDYQTGLVSLDQYIAKTKELQTSIMQATPYTAPVTFAEGWKAAFDQYKAYATDAAAIGGQAFGTSVGLMEDAINTFVNTGKLGFKEFLTGFLKMIQGILTRWLALNVVSMAFGGGSVPLSAMFPTKQAKGGVWEGGVQKFANGGIVNRTTPFGMAGGKMGIMGEAGPEAIMPLKRGPDGKLGVASSGGGGAVNVTNQISVSIGSVDSDERQREMMREIEKMVTITTKKTIADQKRVGGMLYA